MKIIRIREMGSKLLAITLLVALTGFSSVAGATYSLPADRSVVWQGNVGVSGDIPSRTTVYTTLSPSGGDDATAIQTAINNCPTGQVVKLNAGTFKVSAPVTVSKGVVLRGAGMGSTIIQGQASMASNSSYAFLMAIHNWGDVAAASTSVNITSGATKGSTVVTLASTTGFSVGDIVAIDQVNQAAGDPVINNVGTNGACTGWIGCGRDTNSICTASGAPLACCTGSGTGSCNRASGQMDKVVAVSPTTLTLEIPLYWTYANSPQVTKFNNMISGAGIENLTIDNSLSGSSNQNEAFYFRGAANSWLLNVEMIGSYGFMLEAGPVYRTTIRGCKFHEGIPATPYSGPAYNGPSGRGNGIQYHYFGSANLIENNELFHLSQPFQLLGQFSGNVISYNYIHDHYRSDNTAWNVDPINFHGAHSMMNLVEGNDVVGRLVGDDIHGSSSHNTFFRNKAAAPSGVTAGVWEIELAQYNQYYNVIGNVIGMVGVETFYQLNNQNLTGTEKAIYRTGYQSDGDSTASGNDSQVDATLLRHGNWDSVTNGVVWNGSDDRTLPASFYLTSKPSWWGSLQWPAIGPDVSPMYPAALGAGNGTLWSSSKPPLSSPTLLKAQ